MEISSTHQKLDESFKENVCEPFLYLQNAFISKFHFCLKSQIWHEFFVSFC